MFRKSLLIPSIILAYCLIPNTSIGIEIRGKVYEANFINRLINDAALMITLGEGDARTEPMDGMFRYPIERNDYNLSVSFANNEVSSNSIHVNFEHENFIYVSHSPTTLRRNDNTISYFRIRAKKKSVHANDIFESIFLSSSFEENMCDSHLDNLLESIRISPEPRYYTHYPLLLRKCVDQISIENRLDTITFIKNTNAFINMNSENKSKFYLHVLYFLYELINSEDYPQNSLNNTFSLVKQHAEEGLEAQPNNPFEIWQIVYKSAAKINCLHEAIVTINDAFCQSNDIQEDTVRAFLSDWITYLMKLSNYNAPDDYERISNDESYVEMWIKLNTVLNEYLHIYEHRNDSKSRYFKEALEISNSITNSQGS